MYIIKSEHDDVGNDKVAQMKIIKMIMCKIGP